MIFLEITCITFARLNSQEFFLLMIDGILLAHFYLASGSRLFLYLDSRGSRQKLQIPRQKERPGKTTNLKGWILILWRGQDTMVAVQEFGIPNP